MSEEEQPMASHAPQEDQEFAEFLELTVEERERYLTPSHIQGRLQTLLQRLDQDPPEHLISTFTCPACGKTSANPNDVREGYCGACHAFTGT